jgi:hypothetical protein
MDVIASYQANKKVAAEGFQTWRLYVNQEETAKPEPARVLKVQAVLEHVGKLSALMQSEFGYELIQTFWSLNSLAFVTASHFDRENWAWHNTGN